MFCNESAIPLNISKKKNYKFQLAEALLESENLNYDQVVELIGPPKYESAKRKIDPVDFEQSINQISKSVEGST